MYWFRSHFPDPEFYDLAPPVISHDLTKPQIKIYDNYGSSHTLFPQVLSQTVVLSSFFISVAHLLQISYVLTCFGYEEGAVRWVGISVQQFMFTSPTVPMTVHKNFAQLKHFILQSPV